MRVIGITKLSIEIRSRNFGQIFALRCEKQRIVLTRYSNIYIPINYSQVGTLSFVLFRVVPLYEQNLIL